MGGDLAARLEALLGSPPARVAPLSGGCIAEIYRVDLENGERVVAKVADRAGGGDLGLEAYMLRYLAEHSRLPVPGVIHADASLLVIDFMETSGGIDSGAQAHAAELLADLHGIAGPAFGHERDTLIGPLRQPNPPTESWLAFFGEQRLRYMARQALDAGRISGDLMGRVDAFADALDRWLEEPAAPSLIHGDVWGGNVLTRDGRIAGFVDPAIYHADPEIELAFSTLFSTFGDPFFSRYNELRPLGPGFFDVRRDIYNLYPLLVHARLFGGGYAGSVDGIIARLGF